jgi:rhodanese-related sulfurtransferase
MVGTVPTISREELAARLASGARVQLVNVLEPDYYRLGMIRGSLKIPLSQLDQRSSELDPSVDVITYCASYECEASRKAAEKLADRGFSVKAFEGGIKEWTAAGLPMD